MNSLILKEIKNKIFKTDTRNFNEHAIRIFELQSEFCQIYKNYLNYLGIQAKKIKKISQIPFLPVEVFKKHIVYTQNCGNDDLVFYSSGTTSSVKSRHYIKDKELYRNSILNGFRQFYGSEKNYVFLALLPSYIENKSSSLIWMIQCLMKESGNKESRFYGKDYEKLNYDIKTLLKSNKRIFLIGISFALLEYIGKFNTDLSGHIVMETGGMKGKTKELTRKELHNILCRSFNVNVIHSEYGMTELLSQAYSIKEGKYHTPPWMKVLLRDPLDPFDLNFTGHNGGINVIDLANICSCSFLSTMDIGSLFDDGSFEVSGRFDMSDIRGCNLMYTGF